MNFRYAEGCFVATLALLTTTVAKADVTWVCSIIEDGQPQVIKYIVGKSSVTVNDWRSSPHYAAHVGGCGLNH